MPPAATPPVIAVLGASGLIGQALAEGLLADGFAVVAVARRLTASQRAAFGAAALVCPIGDMPAERIAALLAERDVEVLVNCLGVLQDGPRGSTAAVHLGIVERLIAAMRSQARPPLLVHLSIPGRPDDDRTAFSRTKRDAERLIESAGVPHAILRPGFVIAPAAYGGSALVRALAALPVSLPGRVLSRPFRATAVGDIVGTVAWLTRTRKPEAGGIAVVWDVCGPDLATVGSVIDAFRRRFGGPRPRIPLPTILLTLGARFGDVIARLGWAPPIRSTALQEMLRGVEADPSAWAAATGLAPTPLHRALAALPATVQDLWFARLYLAKAVIVVALAVFWVASGLIALTVAFDTAAGILVAHGWTAAAARLTTVVSSLLDISVGVLIACRRTCGVGLLGGIAVSLGYMAGAAVLTPELWFEPLGALVKTAPAIVLMALAYAMLDDRG